MTLGNVFILGDSYSTFEGFIPKGYAVYYAENYPEGDKDKSDVRRVEDTWWHKLITDTGSNLLLNNSWSGSTIGYTGYGGNDTSATSSFICRFKKLRDEGFFEKNKPDTFFIFGGTNDSWSNAPLGAPKFSAWEEEELYCVLPAIYYLLKTVRDTLPSTRICVLINTDIKEEIALALADASQRYGITSITFKAIDKHRGHPTFLGMQQIKDRVAQVLLQK